MEIIPTALDGVVELRPKLIGDHRGWFRETWKRSSFVEAGIDVEFVQDNESMSAAVGTLRGIHYQIAPHPQAKLVRVDSGSILDVAVDLRRQSPTFGRHVAVTLSGDQGNQLLLPTGFGHAFCTLESNVRVAYKVSGQYAPECERSVRWNDPDVGIDWPDFGVDGPVLSDRDAAAPCLADQPDIF